MPNNPIDYSAEALAQLEEDICEARDPIELAADTMFRSTEAATISSLAGRIETLEAWLRDYRTVVSYTGAYAVSLSEAPKRKAIKRNLPDWF